ncbi:hypothetical protein BX600DRAFT_506779 [Xylariales sp. PMI_506]|nr:hypothetical protein BX600DRAFT_506779 [Xylariales sp. PMI_506]
MSSPGPSRKRRAPGTIPQPMQSTYFAPSSTSDTLATWNPNDAANYVDTSSVSNMNPYNMNQQPPFPQPSAQAPSTALARRGMNNQLVTASRPYNPQQDDTWANFGSDSLISPQNGTAPVDEHDNVALLEEKAQKAKRDAQAKRKQIPPFVQKLNSFLEESKNTDLIRWSEKGDSFIVLDEDEFAKTLIPELFKHNNYASFVRQLNMYGFHKKVGLSDNSMKASERKNKSPSEYYNPYFRRGHPNLLWLINKPKSGPAKRKQKRAEDGEVESDDEAIGPPEDTVTQTYIPPSVTPTRALPAPESGPLTKKELAIVRDQMAVLQEQQRAIHDAITRLSREHVQMVTQARQFQEKHNRHENSINAILSFLANVFRKPLEEGGSVRDINDLFSGIISNVQLPQQSQGGSVVDLGDWEHQQPGQAASMGTPAKRPQRLLPPIPQNGGIKTSPSAASTPTIYGGSHQPKMGTVTELFDSPGESGSTPTPSYDGTAQENIMRIMQNVNANAGTGNSPVNLPDLGSGASPGLTSEQRRRMLSIISAAQGNSAASPSNTAFSVPGVPDSGVSTAPSTARMSLSPLMGSAAAPPSIQQMSQTQDEIDYLQKLQEEQSQKLDELSSLLGPYSPSGRIPGMGEEGSHYFDDNIDFGQYLDNSAYHTDGLPNEFDFGSANFDHTNPAAHNADTFNAVTNLGPGSSHIVETSTSNQNTPSPSGTEEITREDLEDSPNRAAKRQRKG